MPGQSLGWEDTLEKKNGNPLQHFCLENHMDRAWRATVHRVANSQTQLKWLHMHTSTTFKLLEKLWKDPNTQCPAILIKFINFLSLETPPVPADPVFCFLFPLVILVYCVSLLETTEIPSSSGQLWINLAITDSLGGEAVNMSMFVTVTSGSVL